MAHIGRFLCLAVLAPLLAACGTSAALLAATGSAGTAATLQITPDPPAALAATTLEVELRNPSGQPITGAVLQLDLTMPGMAMPPNHPAAAEVGNGVYRAPAIFTMAGDWQIQVDASYGGKSERFIFRVAIR